MFASVGNPALRHDWFPLVPGLRLSLDSVSGWNPIGLGAPVGYPASFAFVPSLAILAALTTSYGAHVLFALGITLITAFGARRLAWRIGAGVLTQIAAALFALFNPWFYSKLVAGHQFMLLAYGATYWLVAECLARRPSPRILVCSAIFIAPQIQFVVLDAIVFLILAVRSREYRPLAAVVAALLPVAVGVWVSRSSLVGIPLTAEWEIGQSVDPFAGTLLRGYFTLYDSKLDPFLAPVLWVIVVLASGGALEVILRGHRMRWIVVATTLCLLVAFGLRGPLAGPFTFSIQHVPESGLFRELYDLLGYAAIGYCALCCAATLRFRPAALLFAGAATALAVTWLAYPPSRYWVDSGLLPHAAKPAFEHARFVLLPAIAPVQFGTRGSGVDPDVRTYEDDASPLNEPNPQFPISNALGEYLNGGSSRRLGALSAREIILRPWLQTDVASLAGQLAFAPDAQMFLRMRPAEAVEGFVPELTLSATPHVGALNSTQGAGNVFFADAAQVSGDPKTFPSQWRTYAVVSTVRPANRFVHASEGWVDARLGFLEQPVLGQAFGGALTTRPNTLLPLSGGLDTLVWVRGTLFAQTGEALSGTTGGYRWLRLPSSVRAVHCAGECVVAAQGRVPPNLPLEPAPQPFTEVMFQRLAPWLVVADAPPGASGLLRYNVRYDKGWSAFEGASRLPHVRIDTAVNGWLLAPQAAPAKVILVEVGAVCVALAEVVALLAQVMLLISVWRRPRSPV